MGGEAKGYQGWKNYETWAVHLWISNDQGTHEYWDALAAEAYETEVKDAGDGSREIWTAAAAIDLADRMERELDDEAEQPRAVDGTLYADLLSAALVEVDWYEVAEAYVENTDRDQIEKDSQTEAD